MSDLIHYQDRDTAFRNRLKTFAVINKGHIDVQQFLDDAFHYIKIEVNKMLDAQTLIKFSMCFKAEFSKLNVNEDGNETTIKETLHIQTETSIVDFETDFHAFFNDILVTYVLHRIDEAIMKGSLSVRNS